MPLFRSIVTEPVVIKSCLLIQVLRTEPVVEFVDLGAGGGGGVSEGIELAMSDYDTVGVDVVGYVAVGVESRIKAHNVRLSLFHTALSTVSFIGRAYWGRVCGCMERIWNINIR